MMTAHIFARTSLGWSQLMYSVNSGKTEHARSPRARFTGKTGAGDALLCRGGFAVIMTSLRTPLNGEKAPYRTLFSVSVVTLKTPIGFIFNGNPTLR